MWGSALACFIFLQSRSEPHLLWHHTLPAVLFSGELGARWLPPPHLAILLVPELVLPSSGGVISGLVSQRPPVLGGGVSPGEAGKCWGSRVPVLHNLKPLPHPRPHNLSFTSQAEPILCPLMPCSHHPHQLPASLLFLSPGGLVAGVIQQHAGLPPSALSTPMCGFLSSGRLVGGQPAKGRLLCIPRGAWSPGCSPFRDWGPLGPTGSSLGTSQTSTPSLQLE